MTRRIIFFVLLPVWILALLCPLTAQTDPSRDINQYLAQHYKKKVRLLRHFYLGEQLKYDATGAPIGQVEPGFWTLTGIIQIENIGISAQGVEIQAKRMLLAADRGKKLDYAQSDRVVVIMIETGPQPLTPEQAEAVLAKVFLTEQDHFEELVPQYWKTCIAAATAGGVSEGKEFYKFSEKFQSLPGVHVISGTTSPAQSIVAAQRTEPVEHIGKSVSAPKPLYTPEPEYSGDAKKAKIQGKVHVDVIVGAAGLPTNIWIERPLGYGLDEMAIRSLQTWKFSPALRDGQPVAVKLEIDVDFSFY